MSGLKKNDDNLTSYVIGIILILSVSIVPLICRLNSVPVSDVEHSLLRSSTAIYDIFSYSKSICLCVLAAVLVIFFALDILTQTSPAKPNLKKPQFILIGVYVALAVISAVFSKYKPVSFNGISERYEGLWVLLSYVVLFLFSQIFINKKRNLYFILIGFFLSALLIGGIGMMQFFGKDIFKNAFAIKIIVGKYYGKIKGLNVKFDSAYSTLYNPNCLGLYSAMLSPFFLAITFFAPLKSLLKYISIPFSVIMLINLIGSDSLGGLLGFAVAMFVMAAVFVSDVFFNKKYKVKPVLYCSIFISS